MIVSFEDKETQKIWLGIRSHSLPSDIQEIARRKLRMIHNSFDINDLRSPPGNRLKQLSGRLAEFWSIRINDQWRVIFIWSEGNAHRVSIVDYH